MHKKTPLIIFYDQSMSSLEKKGEIEEGYFDPADLHSEFILINTGDCNLSDESKHKLFSGKTVVCHTYPMGIKGLIFSVGYSPLGLFLMAKSLQARLHLGRHNKVLIRCYGLGSHQLLANAVAKIIGAPLIVSLHCVPFPKNNLKGITEKLQELLLKNKMIKALKNASAVVYVYDAIESFLIENYIAQRVLIRNYLPIRSEAHYPSPEKFETQNTCSKETLVDLIYVGRITYGKHPEIIIRSLVHLSDRFRLTIIGDGPLLPSLKDLVSELNLVGRVKFLGSLPNPLVVSYLQSSFLFVGYSEYEEFPKTYIEAQAAGLPIITNKIKNVAPEIEKSCLVVEPNSSSYADAILTLSSERDVYKVFKGKSFDFYTANYGNTIILERLGALYEKVFTR